SRPTPGPSFTPSTRPVLRLDVPVQQPQELLDQPLAPERGVELAVDVDRRLGLLERAGQRDADVRVLRLARAVDHAAHDRDAQLLHARVAHAPLRQALPDVALDLLGHLLEERAGRPAAARARRDLRREAADLERLEDLLRDAHLFRAVAA